MGLFLYQYTHPPSVFHFVNDSSMFTCCASFSSKAKVEQYILRILKKSFLLKYAYCHVRIFTSYGKLD